MDHNTRALISLLYRFAYREGDVVLSSGRRSTFYLDAKQVTYRPDGIELAGQAVLERIRPYTVDAVGGLTLGADAIVASAVLASKLERTPLTGFVIRKEPKGHGLQKWIEGVKPDPGSRVAIVDDVVTSGGSILRAIHAATEAELEVAVVVPLVDREEGGADNIRAEGIDFHPVCTLSEVREAARQESLIGTGS